MKRIKLTRNERAIEDALLKGEYVSVGKAEFEDVAQAVAHRKKDAVLNIRVNSQDLRAIKAQAQRHGIKYQTLIAELLHRVAHS